MTLCSEHLRPIRVRRVDGKKGRGGGEGGNK